MVLPEVYAEVSSKCWSAVHRGIVRRGWCLANFVWMVCMCYCLDRTLASLKSPSARTVFALVRSVISQSPHAGEFFLMARHGLAHYLSSTIWMCWAGPLLGKGYYHRILWVLV